MKKLFILFILFSTFTFGQDKIQWVSIEEAEQIQLENPEKLMFIDIYTDWCGWCKKMDKSTFKDQKIVSLLSDKYIAVKFDAEQEEDINFKNRKFKFVKSGSRGYHQLAAAMLQGQLSYPSYLVLNSEGEVTQLIKGFQNPTQLMEKL